MGRHKRKKNARYEMRISQEQLDRFRTYTGGKSLGQWLQDLGEREISRLQHKARRYATDPPKKAEREQMMREAFPNRHTCPLGTWCEECGKIG